MQLIAWNQALFIQWSWYDRRIIVKMKDHIATTVIYIEFSTIMFFCSKRYRWQDKFVHWVHQVIANVFKFDATNIWLLTNQLKTERLIAILFHDWKKPSFITISLELTFWFKRTWIIKNIIFSLSMAH